MSVLKPIKDIIVDPNRFQFRESYDPQVVRDYAELLADGVDFPAVTVFDTEEGLILVDGFQRMAAHTAIDKRKIICDVKDGSVRDAILYALSANVKNASRLTNADKRKAASYMFNDPELSLLSDNEISKRIGATQPAVSKWRKELEKEKLEKGEIVEKSNIRKVTKKSGVTYDLDVAKQNENRKASISSGGGTVTSKKGQPRNKPDLPPLLEELEKVSEQEEKALDGFTLDTQEVISNFEIDKVTLGDIYQAGDNRIIFQSDFKKIKKLLDPIDYDLVIYSGGSSDLIKHSWILNLCSDVLIQCFTGDCIKSLQDLDMLVSTGTLILINNTPSYVAHYCEQVTEVQDLALSSHDLYLKEFIEAFTKKEEKVLLIFPTQASILAVEKLGRVVDVIHKDENLIQREIASWINHFGDSKPLAKL